MSTWQGHLSCLLCCNQAEQLRAECTATLTVQRVYMQLIEPGIGQRQLCRSGYRLQPISYSASSQEGCPSLSCWVSAAGLVEYINGSQWGTVTAVSTRV